MNSPKNNTISFKSIVIGSVVASIGYILMNSYTIVEDGTAKTGKLFGEIKPDVYDAGFYIVNPLIEMTTFDIKENMFKLEDVTIPSQDKFKSKADVTVQWSIDVNNLPTLQRTIGTQSQIEDKILAQPLLSILREAGRDVLKAQDLFRGDVQDTLQNSVLDGLRKVASGYGVHIYAVYVKDITLPKVIQNSIVTTKQLEEQEYQERARLKQQELIYARKTAEAEAKAKSAEQNKIASKYLADAEAYRVETEADAALYTKVKEAEGNKAIAKSITKDLLLLRDKETALTQAQHWKGGCTSNCTELNSDKVTPLFHMNNRAQNKLE